MSRTAKKVQIKSLGQPVMGDLFANLIAQAIADRFQIKLAAVDGQLVNKKPQNKRS